MRIIGGDARGRTIVAPAGAKTRPTQDYVRESLFNIIRWDVEDARVLDLFAGTGALSLEALSRGARSAVLVDMDRAAGAAIRKNMETSRLSEKCRLIPRDYHAAMDALAAEGARFDLVFIDPPYKMENTGEMCAALYDKGLLAEAFLLVVEHRKGRAPMLALKPLICVTTATRRSPSFAARSRRKKEARKWILCSMPAVLIR